MGLSGESHKQKRAILALADGTIFEGYAVGAAGTTTGEVVFNTSLFGYQEILTDPSYRRQILTFTYPHIGNVGANPDDVESDRVHVAGVVVRDLSTHYSNFRGRKSLQHYLEENGVVGIGGIDTRALVMHLRNCGSQMGVISSNGESVADLIERARGVPSIEGLDLVGEVTTKQRYSWGQGSWSPVTGFREYTEVEQSEKPLCVALDFGIKYNILRLLVDSGFRVEVVPATTAPAEILALRPQAIFLSNGPGDPAAVTTGIETTRTLLGQMPLFGICLGHQILGHATGLPTFKLKFGHRGGNHPVRNERTGKVEITVQNHGFASRADRVPAGVTISHMNLNDQTVEGLEIPDARAFSVQYHPESSPGPHDASYLFTRFRELVDAAG